MDNLAHTLCAAALAKTRLGRASRLAPLSLIVGANLPDADIAARLFGGKEAYLLHHRGITHSLCGVVVQALLLAAVVRFTERRCVRTAGDAPLPPWRAFLLPAFVGLLSHPALDFLNTYGVRPWLPFSTARYYADLVFIVDPVLWLLFGATAALAGRRTPVGSATWTVLAAGTSWFVWNHARTPDHVKRWWFVAIALLALLRIVGVGARRPRTVLASGALLTLLYLGGVEACAQVAVGRNQRQKAAEPGWQFQMRAPSLANPLEWRVWWRAGGTYFVEKVDVFGGERSEPGIPRELDDPRVIEAMKKPRAEVWRHFARLPYAHVVDHPDGSCTVTLTDARYNAARGPDWSSIEIDLPATR